MRLLFLEPFLTPVLFIFIASILLSVFFLMRGMYKKEKEFQQKQECASEDYEKILTDAHTQAEHLIQNAAREATDLSKEGKDFTAHVTEQVDQACKEIIEKNITQLTNSSEDFLTLHQNNLENLKSKYETELQKIMQQIQQDTKKDFALLQESIRQKTLDSRSGLNRQLEDEFTKTQVAIHEYKKRKLQEINQNMDKLVMKVAQEVLGQSIPLTQQQQLITQALERAQKEGMFDG